MQIGLVELLSRGVHGDDREIDNLLCSSATHTIIQYIPLEKTGAVPAPSGESRPGVGDSNSLGQERPQKETPELL